MKITDILSPKSVLWDNNCHSKKDALDIIAGLISESDNTTIQTEIFDCLIARERLGSTGLGNGIAIPHGRLKNSKKTTAAFLRLGHGIDYDALDKQPVDLLFALIVPEESVEEHLQLLQTLAKMFSDAGITDKIRQAGTPEEIYTILIA